MRATKTTRGARRLAEPERVKVTASPDGRPGSIEGRRVEAIRDSWIVEDRWWTKAPIRRRYYEAVTVGGTVEVVYREPAGRWLRHR